MIFLLTFLACGLFMVYGALIVTYQRAWKAIPVFLPASTDAAVTRISVLIPARNEEKNIAAASTIVDLTLEFFAKLAYTALGLVLLIALHNISNRPSKLA